MATTINNSWSLLSFASGKRMQIGNFVSPTDGSTFRSCIFTDNQGNREFVGFSSKLGELTPSQISAMKNELQIVQLESGSLKLCKVGENNWKDVIL